MMTESFVVCSKTSYIKLDPPFTFLSIIIEKRAFFFLLTNPFKISLLDGPSKFFEEIRGWEGGWCLFSDSSDSLLKCFCDVSAERVGGLIFYSIC